MFWILKNPSVLLISHWLMMINFWQVPRPPHLKCNFKKKNHFSTISICLVCIEQNWVYRNLYKYMWTTKNIAISSRRGECDINFNKSSILYLSRVHSGSWQSSLIDLYEVKNLTKLGPHQKTVKYYITSPTIIIIIIWML